MGCVGVDVCGRGHLWAWVVCGCGRVWVCVGIAMCGRGCVWAWPFMGMGCAWALPCVGVDVCGRGCVGVAVCGLGHLWAWVVCGRCRVWAWVCVGVADWRVGGVWGQAVGANQWCSCWAWPPPPMLGGQLRTVPRGRVPGRCGPGASSGPCDGPAPLNVSAALPDDERVVTAPPLIADPPPPADWKQAPPLRSTPDARRLRPPLSCCARLQLLQQM